MLFCFSFGGTVLCDYKTHQAVENSVMKSRLPYIHFSTVFCLNCLSIHISRYWPLLFVSSMCSLYFWFFLSLILICIFYCRPMFQTLKQHNLR